MNPKYKTYVIPVNKMCVEIHTIQPLKDRIKFELKQQNKSLVKFFTREAAETWCKTMRLTIL